MPILKIPSFQPKPHSSSKPHQKVPAHAPSGSTFNNDGKLVNKHGQLLNDKGQAINKRGHLINENNHRINDKGQLVNKQNHPIDDKGRLINDKGHLINTHGKLINDSGLLIDTTGRLVNNSGRLVDPSGKLIDKDGKFVNREGFLIDKIGRPLDKDGKVARDKASAAKGNNEPHEQTLPPAVLLQVNSWLSNVPPPVATPKLTIADAVMRISDADKMVKAGIISNSPSGAAVARDAVISSAITGLISAPINIGAYAGSTAAAERIKASYLPVPLTPPTPSAKSAVEVAAGSVGADADIDVEEFYERMSDAQQQTFVLLNKSIELKFGDTVRGIVPDLTWSNDPLERLEKLENLLDHAELHTSEVADQYTVFFKPALYVPIQKAAEGIDGLEARLDTVEKRMVKINTAHDCVVEKMTSLAKDPKGAKAVKFT